MECPHSDQGVMGIIFRTNCTSLSRRGLSMHIGSFNKQQLRGSEMKRTVVSTATRVDYHALVSETRASS